MIPGVTLYITSLSYTHTLERECELCYAKAQLNINISGRVYIKNERIKNQYTKNKFRLLRSTY